MAPSTSPVAKCVWVGSTTPIHGKSFIGMSTVGKEWLFCVCCIGTVATTTTTALIHEWFHVVQVDIAIITPRRAQWWNEVAHVLDLILHCGDNQTTLEWDPNRHFPHHYYYYYSSSGLSYSSPKTSSSVSCLILSKSDNFNN